MRVGSAKTIKRPKDEPVDNWYHVRKSAADQSALCYGDSGGPSFRLDDKHDTRDASTHLIYAVNSMGNIRDLSLLAANYLPKAQRFYRDFARENNVEICGINKDCLKGEGGEPEEPKRKCRRLYKKMKKYERRFKKYERRYEASCQASFFEQGDYQDDVPVIDYD